jgi:hypothetical protein
LTLVRWVNLADTMLAMAAGTWRPPVRDIPDEERDPVFHEFATVWF